MRAPRHTKRGILPPSVTGREPVTSKPRSTVSNGCGEDAKRPDLDQTIVRVLLQELVACHDGGLVGSGVDGIYYRSW